jgi:hypothetical protein
VGADAPVEQYDLYVRDERTKEIIFHSTFNPVTKPGEPTRDLTKDKLKLAIKLSRPGEFKLLLVGVIGAVENGGKPAVGATQLFWAGRVNVTGTTNIDARLLTVPDGNDTDRDLWPDRDTWLAANPEAANLYRGQESLLDCNDKMPNPVNSDGMQLTLAPGQINPFAKEVCTEKLDRDCDGVIAPCVDEDGDGDVAGSDCDDKDPARHKPTSTDPFPDPPNCCGYSLGKTGDEANMNFLGQPICPTARCGNGVDESCSGRDTTCVVDSDCDGVPAPPMGNDCDDNDPEVHPGAPKRCGAAKDYDCSNFAGCVACDLDGDGYERLDPANGCPRMGYTLPVDCNDYDAGVFPGQSSKAVSSTIPSSGMKETAADANSHVVAALRGNCRRVYEPTGTTGTAKIGVTGFMVGDADCNGVAFEGCPSPACDADGDGWPNGNPGCPAPPPGFGPDCVDTDPTVFPGAPDKCGSNFGEGCGVDSACTGDTDGDGYLPPFDCDNNNAAVHPWAKELCNGIDDDCDGLVDEGNPDPSGNPLVTTGAITSCTTSDVGECGKNKGLCVCSSADNKATPDPMGRRTFCPGEQTATAGSRHAQCYGAGQPKPQTCDATNKRDDDCDGRNDDPMGVNIGALKGMPCGFNQGQCKQGTVVGCDYSRDNPYFTFGLTFATGGGTAATRGYVCSSDTVNPSTEVCDGIDNDCNGALVGSGAFDEVDSDNDKYLACTIVGTPAPGVLGGGDCDDSVATTYPGAPELCDNIDNNCANGVADDGATQCVGATPNCCSSQAACRNLANDFNNCTACGMACSPLVANNCGMGGNGCRCGNGPACSLGSGSTPGSWCDAGTCTTCNTAARCGPSCVTCGANQVCKTDGSGCTGCNTDSDCAPDRWCNNGVCTPDLAPGAECTRAAQCPAASPNCTSNGNGRSFCCNVASCAGCQTCTSGVCENAAAGTDPNGFCSFNFAGCIADTCDGNNSCTAPNNTPCAAQVCVGSTLSGATCQGGTCTPFSSACPGNYACLNATTCRTTCNMNSDCASGYFCNASNQCVAKRPNGMSCVNGGQCTSGNCVDGVCCADPSCPTCQTCAGATPGTCTNIAANQDDNNPLGACAGSTQSCDGNGNCKLERGQACGTNDAACLTNHCADGVCCDSACTGECNSCNSAGNVGTCTVVAGAGNPSCSPYLCVSGGGPTCPNSCPARGAPNVCAAGYCCNGATCVDSTANTSCGSSCVNCTTQTNNRVCVAGACGCTSYMTDCDPATADRCDTTCRCGATAACDPATQQCVDTGMGAFVCLKKAGQPCALGMECASGMCTGMPKTCQ